MNPLRQFLAASVLFAALTAVMTWPQARQLSTGAMAHQDVYFNMWRLGWFAHALRTQPLQLFDANIFHPEPRTLTYSDAMPVEGTLAAPLLWAGAPPVLVHNLVLLGGIVFSAAGMFVLARHLAGSTLGAICAGIVFAFAPYRFTHYMHMELQWAAWVPWALWALHRACETGLRKYGVLAGVFLALQMLSSIYYGVFLATLLALVGTLLAWRGYVTRAGAGRPAFRDLATSLVTGALVAATVSAIYAVPYLATRRHLGDRPVEEIQEFSATPSSYLAATPTNLLYGRSTGTTSGEERRLFPGVLAVVLALAAVLRRPRPHEVLVYLVTLAVAFEMSLGTNGFTYAFLHRYVPAYTGLRAPARLGIFVLVALAVLVAYGVTHLSRHRTGGARVVRLLVPALLLLEYWVAPLPLVRYVNDPPPVYTWLASLPRGVVAEFPMPRIRTLPGQDPLFTYFSTFHWMPLVNGYSGHYPESYFRRIEGLASFPDDESIARLQREQVRYLVVHEWGYRGARWQPLVDRLLTHQALSPVVATEDGDGAAMIFELRLSKVQGSGFKVQGSVQGSAQR